MDKFRYYIPLGKFVSTHQYSYATELVLSHQDALIKDNGCDRAVWIYLAAVYQRDMQCKKLSQIQLGELGKFITLMSKVLPKNKITSSLRLQAKIQPASIDHKLMRYYFYGLISCYPDYIGLKDILLIEDNITKAQFIISQYKLNDLCDQALDQYEKTQFLLSQLLSSRAKYRLSYTSLASCITNIGLYFDTIKTPRSNTPNSQYSSMAISSGSKGWQPSGYSTVLTDRSQMSIEDGDMVNLGSPTTDMDFKFE